MASKKNKIKDSEKELTLEEKIQCEVIVSLADVACPICLCILVEPVSMPCHHVICSPCFQETLTHSNISCPVCRARLSSWARKATKQKTLVNKIIWDFIQDKFSLEVKSRLEGDDITDPDEILPCIPNHQFAETGEIKSEFEAALTRENEAREKLKREEEEKSKDLILKYKEEYELNRRREIEDQELALMIQNTPSPGKENRLVQKKKNIVRGPLDSFLSSSQPMSPSQGSQSLLKSPVSSQSTMEKSNKNSQNPKTLFSPNNITKFMKENKLPSQRQSISPLAIRSSKADSENQKDLNTSPAASTQKFESSLLLELEDSPNLFSSSANNSSCKYKSQSLSEKSPLNSHSSERSQDLKLNESGDIILFEEKNSSEDNLYKASLEDRKDEKGEKSKSELDEETTKGEKSKCLVGDDKDMFENESENLLSIDSDKVYDSQKHNTCDDNENLLEPIAGPSKPTAEYSHKAILATDSIKSFLDISDEASLIEEQIEIAKQIEQEKKDMEMARKLQLQLDKESRSVDRRKGSENGYSLRVATPKSVSSNKKRRRNSSGKKDKNQMSIQDSFKRTKLNFKESDEVVE